MPNIQVKLNFSDLLHVLVKIFSCCSRVTNIIMHRKVKVVTSRLYTFILDVDDLWLVMFIGVYLQNGRGYSSRFEKKIAFCSELDPITRGKKLQVTSPLIFRQWRSNSAGV